MITREDMDKFLDALAPLLDMREETPGDPSTFRWNCGSEDDRFGFAKQAARETGIDLADVLAWPISAHCDCEIFWNLPDELNEEDDE